MITKYHARYYAQLLAQKSVCDDIGTISQSLLSASVDINPNQIDAALFAFKSPDGLENEIDTIKRTIRETERLARLATNVKEQIELQQKAEDLRRQKRRKRNELEDREDEVAARRKALIKELENKMIQTTTTNNIFYIRWQINA